MKNLQFNPYQCRIGRVGSKKSKPIAGLPCGVRLKSCLISTPLPLQDKDNSHAVKWGKIVVPNYK